jgi:hypothetical protein
MRRSLLLLSLAACGGVPFSVPSGFAGYDGSARAVSPDGVLFAVRTVPHEPAAELPFWKEAMRRRMDEAGYVFQREGEVRAGSQPGWLLEVAAPMGPVDYLYLVAVFIRGDELVLVEAAGEVTHVEQRRQAMLDAIAALPL